MPRPEQTALEILEERRRKAGQLFQSARDVGGQERWIGEYVRKHGALVHLVTRTTRRDPQGPMQSAGVDPLFGDITDPEFLEGTRTDIRSLIDHEPSKQLLSKYGIEEDREVVFWLPRILLDEKGLITPVRFRGVEIGDLFVWDRAWYIVQEAHRDHYQGVSDHFFYVGAFCNRYHHNSVPSVAPSDC